MSATVFYNSASELATLTDTFSVAGVPTNPTSVTLTVTSPAGVVTAPTPTSAGSGVYTCDVACNEVGVWQYLWVGTGAATDAIAGTWTVSSAELQRLYCTPEELKSRLGITDTLDDAEVLGACEAASRAIDDWCERRFWRGTATYTYAPCGTDELNVHDLVSVTSVKTDTTGDGVYETTWATTDYQLKPFNAATDGQPYTKLYAVGSYTFPVPYGRMRTDLIQITGVFGWPSLQASVKEAARLLAADALKAKDAPFGVAGFGEYGPIRVGSNGRATGLLERFKRYDPPRAW